jgi:PAS domain S-box-containing protein
MAITPRYGRQLITIVTSSIKIRLFVNTLCMLALLGMMWIAGTLSTNALHAGYTRSVHHIDALAAALLEGSMLRDDEESSVRGYLLTGQKTFLAPYYAALPAAPALQQRIDALIADDPQMRPLVMNRRRAGQAWANWAADVLKHPHAYDRDSPRLIAQQLQGKALFDRYRAAIAAGTAVLNREQRNTYNENSSLLTRVNVLFAVLFAGAIAAGVLFGWRTMLAVTRPLAALGRAAQAIGEGDLDRPVEVEGARAFTNLARNMDWMRDQLALQARLAAEREAELRDNEERFRGAFDLAAVGMAMVGVDGRWLRVNATLCAVVGYGESELLAMTYDALTHPEDRAIGAQGRHDMLEGLTRAFVVEKRYIHKDGRTIWVNLGTALVPDANGAPLYFISQIENITARKEAEAALEANKQELERSNAELQQFAYVASHDLQEPLRTISSYLQLLHRRYKGKELDDNAEEFITFAVDGAKRMQALIQDLLAYSRVGKRDTAFAPTDCGTLAAEVVAALQATIVEKGAVVEHDALPIVLGDASQLRQLLQNLVGNALKFCKEAPVIRISAQPHGEQWQFTVRDNGIGIDPAHAERVFIIFQRLHTREEYEGTGIGLALCRKIVERHGGRIWVESRPGQGAAFHFMLPAQASAAENVA